MNDRTLKSISTLSNLRKLTIEEGVISEEGIEHLAMLAHLQSVDVPSLHWLQDSLRLAESVDDEQLPQPIRS